MRQPANIICLYLYCLSIILLQACSNSQKNPPPRGFGEQNFESFSFSCQSDTTIRTKDGVQIIIHPSTFDCAKEKIIHVQFKSALKISDMLAAGLTTMDDNLKPLESGGMFFLEVTSGQTANANHPIIIKVPTKFSQEDMLVFEKKADGNWEKSTAIITISNKKRLALGKKIYLDNCTNCHNSNLNHDMTGPALGNIHRYRDRAWLIEFTRNSSGLIDSRDSIALCLYRTWNHSQMTSFAELSENEINAIYDWIENTSRAKRLKNKNSLSKVDCYALDSIAKVRAIEYKRTVQVQKLQDSLNRSRQGFSSSTTSTITYSSPMPNGYGWINYDRYFGKYPPLTIPILNVQTPVFPSYLQAYLVLKGRKTILPFNDNKVQNNQYKIYSSDPNGKIALPVGETAFLLVYQTNSKTKEVTHYYIKEYRLSDQIKELPIQLTPIENDIFIKTLKEQFD